ncbi:hypothetical protein PENTCL1PPCAC_2401, partial [Pristionchus entomophagus]
SSFQSHLIFVMSTAVAATSTPKVKKTIVKKVSVHPPYASMVKQAIAGLADKKGSSRAAILKYVCGHFKVGDNVIQINSRIRAALKKGTAGGALNQVKGNGASGSFRLGEKKTAEKKKVTKSVKKPVAKKSTTASPKKKTVKKTSKTTKPKSPKKAKAPKKTAAAKPKKAKSPKKKTAAKKAKAPKAPKA